MKRPRWKGTRITTARNIMLLARTLNAFSTKWKTGPCMPTSSSKGTSSAPSPSSSPSNICSTCASRRAACISHLAATFSAFLLII
ncbi:hypothetical protein HanRHA438_Chr03g0116881 [Helianthus annuus]|uniref:Uncharacterized protein n=1 Tax=Helianthus annuus TaxID=4232 RepID=A0A9K3NWH3_HELAN|nr:hypothetical protein HanXRQr2_Chr03g0106231 [Helianthus annuus]KAJ0935249.1 hypothetical protein HanRHA438_Chr03g0116881 [Helianthus annuus]KAJ0943317.1 hypothetical protein HanPSC8_Chr03g0102781 [Helianthus annuus]